MLDTVIFLHTLPKKIEAVNGLDLRLCKKTILYFLIDFFLVDLLLFLTCFTRQKNPPLTWKKAISLYKN